MRKPKVENIYNLTIEKIKKLKYNRDKVNESGFYRNNAVDAWCISKTTAKNDGEYECCAYNSFWLAIYDDDAEMYAGELILDVSSHGGMCNYNFNEFYRTEDIECEIDLEIQELILESINKLIKEDVLYVE
jgi:hypothetical protein